MSDYLDDDGYPTEEALEKIKNWPYTDLKGLLEFVEELWSYPHYINRFINEEGRLTYEISTGGWSGNEDIIGALQENTMFWVLCWVQSRRGGHYIFEIQ